MKAFIQHSILTSRLKRNVDIHVAPTHWLWTLLYNINIIYLLFVKLVFFRFLRDAAQAISVPVGLMFQKEYLSIKLWLSKNYK